MYPCRYNNACLRLYNHLFSPLGSLALLIRKQKLEFLHDCVVPPLVTSATVNQLVRGSQKCVFILMLVTVSTILGQERPFIFYSLMAINLPKRGTLF